MDLDGIFKNKDDYQLKKNILLRDYQIRLLERAKRGNTIIYLPAGAGKTLIAIHLLNSRTQEVNKPFNEGGKRAFFIAPTRLMVLQLGKVIQTHTKFKVGCFTGEISVDSWDRNIWITQFIKYHVLVLTGEILRHILQMNFISPENISLLVCDECHHAVADHPYRMLMQIVCKSDSSEAPLILGLSSVLIHSNLKKGQVWQTIQNLESTMKGKIVADSEIQEIIKFSANPKEKTLIYKEFSPSFLPEFVFKFYDTIAKELSDMILKPTDDVIPDGAQSFKIKNKIKRIRNAFVKSKEHLKDFGVFFGSLSALYFIIKLEKYRLLSKDPNEIEILIYARTELHKIRHALQKYIGEEETAMSIINFSSPKIISLIHILEETKKLANENSFSLLIFVQERAVAAILANLLKRLSILDRRYSFIKADFVVGSQYCLTQQCPNLNKSFFAKSKNEIVLEQFASRSLNVLVTTNVLEEGIDICSCNVVISFDFPSAYSNYIQCRGRARDKNSWFFIFVKESEVNEKKNLIDGYKNLQTELFQKISEDYENMEEKEIGNNKEDVEKVCLNGKSRKIIVDALTAVKAVHRYCSKLPQDMFTMLSPKSWFIVVDKKKKGFLELPVNCPLREVIEGEFRINKKLAKRSVYLAALKRLYDIRELDEDLNIRSIEEKINFKKLFPHFKEENIDENLPQAGTKKRKQIYSVKFAESLSNCLPRPGIKAYLHVINFTVVFDKPELERKIAIYEILKIPVTFAMISTKKLRKILQFPLFIDLGEIKCDLLVNYDEIILTESEIKDIKMCHFVLFQKVIKVVKTYQVFDNRNEEHSFFIAPVEKNDAGRFVLKWSLIRNDFCQNSKSAVVRYNPTSSRKNKDDFFNYESYNIMDNKKISDSLIPINATDHRLAWENWQNEYGQNYKPSKFEMNDTDYRFFVFTPSYRKDNPSQYYIVNKFCYDLSPLSKFPNELYEDYLDYYQNKYSIKITDVNQPLLKVSTIYDCSNFNRPRNKKVRRARDKVKELQEHLIPELCDVVPFDRRFWLKALLLPTALNRIYHVYSVEEFRRKTILEMGLGSGELSEGANWKPLEVNNFSGNEENEEISAFTNVKALKSFPLSVLKSETQDGTQVILEPERQFYESNLCDLEFLVSGMMETENQTENLEETQLEEDDKVLNLVALEKEPVPALQLLKGGNGKSVPDLAGFIQACTSKSANDIVDYERLEILGDSLLKFAVTCFLFKNYSENEGVLSSLKGKIIGNRNLFYCGLKKGIQNVINVSDFVPLCDWNPPLICVPKRLVDGIINMNVDSAVLYRFDISPEEQFSGILSENTFKKNEEILQEHEKCSEMLTNSLLPCRIIEDKTISDCVEALIGVFLLNLGLFGALEFLLWLEVLPKQKGSYSELIEKPFSLHKENDTAVMCLLTQVFYSDLEDVLHYHFENKILLLEALTHPSYVNNKITGCYQRLEFLGDAVLDFLITIYIYENCDQLTPGQITDIRSSLVNNITFACLVVRYEIYKHMLSFSCSLNKSIENFVAFQISRNHVIDDNVLILSEENECMMAESVQVPKALSDLFESLAGAIFLDSKNSFETVWEVFYRLMKREIDEFIKKVPKPAVRLVQEICGDKPYYDVEVINGVTKVECSVYYNNREIKAFGFGRNKKEGKQSAAKLILKQILELKNEVF